MPNTTSRRYYTNNAPSTTLTATINNSVTSLTVASVSGYPTNFPYLGVIEANTGNEEIVSVTAAVGTTLTVVRGQDGTAAISHLSGVSFDHGVVRQDVDESNAHSSASAGVHGVAGSVVGTTDTQTLSNKTLTSPTINSPTIAGSGTIAAASATLTGQLQAGSAIAPNEICQITCTTGAVGVIGTLNATGQAVFDSDYNTLGCAANGLGHFSVVTIPAGKGGRYRLSGQVSSSMNTGRVQCGVSKNGTSTTNLILSATGPASPSGATTIQFGPYDVTLAAGDALSVLINPSASSTNYDIYAGTGNIPQSFLRVERIA